MKGGANALIAKFSTLHHQGTLMKIANNKNMKLLQCVQSNIKASKLPYITSVALDSIQPHLHLHVPPSSCTILKSSRDALQHLQILGSATYYLHTWSNIIAALKTHEISRNALIYKFAIYIKQLCPTTLLPGNFQCYPIYNTVNTCLSVSIQKNKPVLLTQLYIYQIVLKELGFLSKDSTPETSLYTEGCGGIQTRYESNESQH